MADKFNEQLTRERNAVEQVGVIKNAIKSVAENKSIEVLNTDTPQSVLSKIDKFSGGDYNIESAILEDGTQELRIFDAEKGVKETVGRPEPETWKRIRETLHTNPNDQFFLIGSGASDTFALKFSHGTVGTTISVYGGTDGTTLLFSDTTTTNFWSMYLRDLENYPLPDGLHFSDLQGCPYSDDIVGDCELFAVVVHRHDDGISYGAVDNSNHQRDRTEVYNVFEYGGTGISDYGLHGYANSIFCSLCEFVFVGDAKIIGSNAFQGTSIHEFSFPESYTDIFLEGNIFRDCKNLKKVKLPESITNLNANNFWNCTSLESIIIPNSVKTIGGDNFRSCSNLKYVKLPENLTEVVGSMFYACDLRQITLPDTLTKINSSAFYQNRNLKEIIIPETVTYLGDSVFNYCESLQSINIPNAVTYLGNSCFSNCESLRELKSNCFAVNSKINNYLCSSMEKIDLPNTQLKSLYMYGYMYNGNYTILKIGSFGEVEGSESPTLGLKTPILVDYTNSTFDGSTTPIQLYYACLTLDHLKAIFDWLPVTTTARTMKCGNQYSMDLTTGQLTKSTAFDDFLVWYNTLPDTDPGDGTIWKKGWSVIA